MFFVRLIEVRIKKAEAGSIESASALYRLIRESYRLISDALLHIPDKGAKSQEGTRFVERAEFG